MRFVKLPSDVLLHGQVQPRARFHHAPLIAELDVFANKNKLNDRIPLTVETVKAAAEGSLRNPSALTSFVENVMTMKNPGEREIVIRGLLSSNIKSTNTDAEFLCMINKIANGKHRWKVPEALMLLVRFTKNPEGSLAWIWDGEDQTKRAALTALGERIRAGDSLPVNLANRLGNAKKRDEKMAGEIQKVLDLLKAQDNGR